MSKDFSDSKDMLLFLHDTLPVGDHYVTFHGKRKEGVNLYFDMDYLRAEPRSWKQGDTVRVRSSIFVAKDDHVAGSSFLLDQPQHWHPLDSAASSGMRRSGAPRGPGPRTSRCSPWCN
jgi:hypothetical protein